MNKIFKRVLKLLGIVFCTFATSSLIFQTDFKVAKADSYNQYVYGAYCLRDTISETRTGNISIIGYHDLYVYVNRSGNKMYHQSLGFELYLEEDIEFNVVLDNFGSPSITSTIYNYNGVLTLQQNQISDSELPSTFKELVLYFSSPIYLDSEDYLDFISYFTSTGNTYVSSYVGWYTFNNTLSVSDYFNFYGVTSYQNNLYHSFYLNTSNNLVFSADNLDYTAYNGTSWSGINPRVLYFSNTLIPNSVHARLLTFGEFAFIPETIDSDFGELFFSLADTPVYFLYQLFNFELFGINFAIAFTGIITLVIMIWVLKKVI